MPTAAPKSTAGKTLARWFAMATSIELCSPEIRTSSGCRTARPARSPQIEPGRNETTRLVRFHEDGPADRGVGSDRTLGTDRCQPWQQPCSKQLHGVSEQPSATGPILAALRRRL